MHLCKDISLNIQEHFLSHISNRKKEMEIETYFFGPHPTKEGQRQAEASTYCLGAGMTYTVHGFTPVLYISLLDTLRVFSQRFKSLNVSIQATS